MNLVKDLWQEKDIKPFLEYLKQFENKNRVEWSLNLLKTNLPCLAIKSAVLKNIANEIKKGNYLSFLDLKIQNYFENTLINGSLISKIKDFDVMKKYLDIYSDKADNWATCDCLSFDVRGREQDYLNLAKEYQKSKKPFVRRIGMEALFKIIDNSLYINDVFNILNTFECENDYYVNMINAWLLCDLFIKRREETINFLNDNKLNKMTINKMISKCRDSYRVSKIDKDMLLSYKVK